MNLFAILFLAAMVAADPVARLKSEEQSGRIVNGEVADPHQFPYQV